MKSQNPFFSHNIYKIHDFCSRCLITFAETKSLRQSKYLHFNERLLKTKHVFKQLLVHYTDPNTKQAWKNSSSKNAFDGGLKYLKQRL